MSGFFSTSIGRKVSMALSALFLMIFLLQHFVINFTSVLSKDMFNGISHFMGTNPLIQFVMQPILIFGVLYHFIMGFVLEYKNYSSREIKYFKNNAASNSNWMSRNMIYSGLVILAFLILHFADFWIPELKIKFIDGVWTDTTRYYPEIVHKFKSPLKVILYVISFVFLALHLLHGFNSAFQSMGANEKVKNTLKLFGKIYAIGLPIGFIFIALFHHLNQ